MTKEEAIKGLKVLRRDFSGYKPNEEMFDMAIESLEQDCISRQAAKWQKKKVEESTDIDITAWQTAQCSNCKRWHTTPYMYYFYEYNYCPFCGTKMEVEE